MFCIAWSWNKNYHAYMELLFGRPAGRTAQKCSALRGHETKTTTLIWNYCLGSTAAASLLLWIFFGLISSNLDPSDPERWTNMLDFDIIYICIHIHVYYVWIICDMFCHWMCPPGSPWPLPGDSHQCDHCPKLGLSWPDRCLSCLRVFAVMCNTSWWHKFLHFLHW